DGARLSRRTWRLATGLERRALALAGDRGARAHLDGTPRGLARQLRRGPEAPRKLGDEHADALRRGHPSGSSRNGVAGHRKFLTTRSPVLNVPGQDLSRSGLRLVGIWARTSAPGEDHVGG